MITTTTPIRTLTARELATIRAALRLWIETPPEFIGAVCYEELVDVIGLGDDEIAQLVEELRTIGG